MKYTIELSSEMIEKLENLVDIKIQDDDDVEYAIKIIIENL